MGDKVRFKQAPFSTWNAYMKESNDQVFTVRGILDMSHLNDHSLIFVDENDFCYMRGDVAEIL